MDNHSPQTSRTNKPGDEALALELIGSVVMIYALSAHPSIARFFMSYEGIGVSVLCFSGSVVAAFGRRSAVGRAGMGAKCREKHSHLQWQDRVAALTHRHSYLTKTVVHLLFVVSMTGLYVVLKHADISMAALLSFTKPRTQGVALEACRGVYRACHDACGSDDACNAGCRDTYFACREVAVNVNMPKP
ncbi:hypothetical protein FKW77_009106 [Venturia effusa]|uniref:Uncharacterized protein n=1 Tax=Venturia effusa TaxID=50376 RepID=A0A517L425_9PEZI|nr:hypothetical protein FKW77_009106 [Venturia effusa]